MIFLAILAAFIRRDWAQAVSYRFPLLLNAGSIVFTLALFFYLGQLVDRSSLAPTSDRFDRGYFSFVVIGLSLLQIVQTGLSSFASTLRQEQSAGTFEALIATPTAPWVLILGSAAYDILRATLFGLLMLALSVLVFGATFEGDVFAVLIALVALIASLLFFIAVGVVAAAFTVVFKQTLALIGLFVTGLALLGGVYFPLEVLPGPLETVGELLPFTWGLDVLRSALLTNEIDAGRLLLLMAGAAATLPCAFAIFRLALTTARRQGTLTQY